MSIDLSSGVTSDVVTPVFNPRRPPAADATGGEFPRVASADGVRQINAADGNILPGEANAATDKSAVTETQLSHAVSALNRHAQDVQRELEFKVDEELNRVIITVKDAQTEEVIRQIPPEEVVNMARHLRRDGSGVILKTKV